MDLIMDGLLLAAAVFAGTYCFVLARRVRALKDLDSGLGGAITRMTRALEDARRALEEAKAASRDGHKELKELVTRAEAASAQLRILLAATRDLPQAPARSRRDRQRDAEAEDAHRDAESQDGNPLRAERGPVPRTAPPAAATYQGRVSQDEAWRADDAEEASHLSPKPAIAATSEEPRRPARPLPIGPQLAPEPRDRLRAALRPLQAELRQRSAAQPAQPVPTQESDLLAALADFARRT